MKLRTLLLSPDQREYVLVGITQSCYDLDRYTLMPIPLFRETVEGGFFQHTPPESLKDTEIICGQALADLAGWEIIGGVDVIEWGHGDSFHGEIVINRRNLGEKV